MFGRELYLPCYLLLVVPPTRRILLLTTWRNSLIGCIISTTTPVKIYSGQWQDEGQLRSPDQFCGIPGTRQSLAVPPDQDRRKSRLCCSHPVKVCYSPGSTTWFTGSSDILRRGWWLCTWGDRRYTQWLLGRAALRGEQCCKHSSSEAFKLHTPAPCIQLRAAALSSARNASTSRDFLATSATVPERNRTSQKLWGKLGTSRIFQTRCKIFQYLLLASHSDCQFQCSRVIERRLVSSKLYCGAAAVHYMCEYGT